MLHVCSLFSEPDHDTLGKGIYVAHHGDLATSFRRICLVDAYCVDPYTFGRGVPLRKTAIVVFVKELEKIARDVHRMPVTQYRDRCVIHRLIGIPFMVDMIPHLIFCVPLAQKILIRQYRGSPGVG